MIALVVGAQLLAFIALVAVSVWGSKHIEPETRIRARAGASGIDWTMSKKTALVMSPFIGVVVVVSTVALGNSPERETVAMLGLAVILIFLAAHWSSVRRAAR